MLTGQFNEIVYSVADTEKEKLWGVGEEDESGDGVVRLLAR